MDARCLVLSDGRGLWDTNNIRRNERSLVLLRGVFLPSPIVSIPPRPLRRITRYVLLLVLYYFYYYCYCYYYYYYYDYYYYY